MGATGATGAAGPAGRAGPAGPFPAVLPAGLTLRGAFNLGGTAPALDDLANTSLSFVFTLASKPTVIVVPDATTPPANCPGTVALPQAKPGFLCLFVDENANLDTDGLQVNGEERSGATIFVNSASVRRLLLLRDVGGHLELTRPPRSSSGPVSDRAGRPREGTPCSSVSRRAWNFLVRSAENR